MSIDKKIDIITNSILMSNDKYSEVKWLLETIYKKDNNPIKPNIDNDFNTILYVDEIIKKESK
jgi:hypothetical protein